MTANALPHLVDPSAWIEPGDTVLQRYTVIGCLAEGRIGAILKVRDAVDVELVIKTIKPSIRASSTSEQLSGLMAVMAREAELQSAFRHPNIVRVIENGLDARLGVCTAMEYAPLGTLRQRIRAHALDCEQALRILDSLLSALVCMHTPSQAYPLGVVHLDLEPKNIVFGPDDAPKICDFHYARRISLQPEASDWIDADHPSNVRTDLRQLGRMLLEMTDNLQPDGPAAARLRPTLDTFANRLAADDSHGCFQSAAEAREALRGLR